jgi:glycosyltransferase involved in cell wall biosynthesis
MNQARTGRILLRWFGYGRTAGDHVDAARRQWSARLFGRTLRRLYGDHLSYETFEYLPAEDAARWADTAVEPVRLSIVVVTYKQPMALQCLLSSLACQVVQNFEVLIYHDGPDAETACIAERFARGSDRFRYHETPMRHGDWGHSLRALGIEQARGDYLLITNGDNYYVPRFTEFAFQAVSRGAKDRAEDDWGPLDMVLWNLVHSYSSPGRRTLRCYTPFRVFPARYMVDIAAVMVRTALARRVGFADRSHSGDASYVERILSLADTRIRVGKVEKTLAVHN